MTGCLHPYRKDCANFSKSGCFENSPSFEKYTNCDFDMCAIMLALKIHEEEMKIINEELTLRRIQAWNPTMGTEHATLVTQPAQQSKRQIAVSLIVTNAVVRQISTRPLTTFLEFLENEELQLSNWVFTYSCSTWDFNNPRSPKTLVHYYV